MVVFMQVWSLETRLQQLRNVDTGNSDGENGEVLIVPVGFTSGTIRSRGGPFAGGID